MRKRAQLQIMENAFVLLTIFIILVIAFVFVVFIQKQEQKEKIQELKEREIIKKSQILSLLPEMQCSDNNNIEPDCYDILKIISFKETLNNDKSYYPFLLGNIKITIRRYDPSPNVNKWLDTWELYDYPKEDYEGIDYLHFPVLLRDAVNNSDYFGIISLGVYR